jgi:hypothetical protein
MSFIDDRDSVPPIPPTDTLADSVQGEEPIKISLTGSRKAVSRAIHLLHRLNFIAGSAWSRPVETRQTGEVISVAVRQISLD